MAAGADHWELASSGLPAAPAIRAIATHPEHPDTVYVGTQDGPYRSDDHGDHWEKLDVPDHGLPVWSLAFDPRNSQVMFAGYENCEIYRSDDGGLRWRQLPVTVRFPEVTVAAGSTPAKRVMKLVASAANPDEIYGAIEVGGVIRSLDGGEHWENMSHGQYVNDDSVDMHGVLVGRWRPGQVFAIGRAGLFSSADRGKHWASARLEPLNPNGQTYCRDIREAPGDSKTIWVAAGANFQSEVGALFRSKDGGTSWAKVAIGVKPRTTAVRLASAAAGHGGRVVDAPGDNVLAEFASVVDAVQCAVRVQRELQARNAELPPSRQMRFHYNAPPVTSRPPLRPRPPTQKSPDSG